VCTPCLAQLSADAQGRIQGASRTLRYETHQPAADAPQVPLIAACQILTEEHSPAAYARARMIEQAKDGEGQSALARPALAYKSQNFPWKHFNSDPSQHAPFLWVID
jgi:hypothetical protein